MVGAIAIVGMAREREEKLSPAFRSLVCGGFTGRVLIYEEKY